MDLKEAGHWQNAGEANNAVEALDTTVPFGHQLRGQLHDDHRQISRRLGEQYASHPPSWRW
jgi:hypothetical protein